MFTSLGTHLNVNVQKNSIIHGYVTKQQNMIINKSIAFLYLPDI